MSSTSSETSPATPASSVAPSPGLLWVCCHIQTKDPPLTEQLFHDWYAEHLTDVLASPGNGGLTMRYQNLDKSIDVYDDPDLASRAQTPEKTLEAVSKFGWKYLALVKLPDTAWLTSQHFDDIPRTSKQLPKRPDGSIGSAFDVWHAALRSYETTQTSGAPTGGKPKWLLTVQTVQGDRDSLQEVVNTYKSKQGCKYWISYKLVHGLLGFSEAAESHLPGGLIMFQFDGEEPPRVVPAIGPKAWALRTDLWELIDERGDKSLDL